MVLFSVEQQCEEVTLWWLVDIVVMSLEDLEASTSKLSSSGRRCVVSQSTPICKRPFSFPHLHCFCCYLSISLFHWSFSTSSCIILSWFLKTWEKCFCSPFLWLVSKMRFFFRKIFLFFSGNLWPVSKPLVFCKLINTEGKISTCLSNSVCQQ